MSLTGANTTNAIRLVLHHVTRSPSGRQQIGWLARTLSSPDLQILFAVRGSEVRGDWLAHVHSANGWGAGCLADRAN